jgi:hypothetical protein
MVIPLFMNGVYCQHSISEIDFTQIPQKKIRHYLSNQIKNNKILFTDLHPSCSNGVTMQELDTMENSYLIKEPPDVVWKAYTTTNMANSWHGKMISFGLLCSKWSEYVLYKNSTDFCAIDTGQVFFINLRILHGMFNLPVGLQVIDIDDGNMTITFGYLEGGKSIGTQTIKLSPTNQGYTKVTHTSAFKSNSHFRDKRLYPFYHTKVLNEFHQNIARNISTDSTIFYVLSRTDDIN